jgi:hypothetical protein
MPLLFRNEWYLSRFGRPAIESLLSFTPLQGDRFIIQSGKRLAPRPPREQTSIGL